MGLHTRGAPPRLQLPSLLLLITAATCAYAQDPRNTKRPATSRESRTALVPAMSRPRLIRIKHPYYEARISILDSRCYLMNGGAVESFFIGEDTPVGSVIGTLSVNGDPSPEDGDITLKLQERNAAVGIEPGTKNITLLRPLDREEVTGPSNVYVNVRCDRRRSNDPSFIVPVSVRVWDVNDNSPVWGNAPYSVRLSEQTAVGSRVLAGAHATDRDQPGPHAIVHYSVLPSAHSDYFGFVNELDSILVLKKALDYETLSNFTVTLRAEDQGAPPLYSDAQLHVQVLDADDQNPRFTHEHYTVLVPDRDLDEGMELPVSPGPVSAADQDAGLNAPVYYSYRSARPQLVHVEKDTGKVLVGPQLDPRLLPATVVVKATQYDNPDRYALATLTLSRAAPPPDRPPSAPYPAAPSPAAPSPADTSAARPAAPAPAPPARPRAAPRFTQHAYSAAVPEDTPLGAVLLTLHTRGAGGETAAEDLQFYVSDRSFLETFAINSLGEVLLRKPLDYETQQYYAFQVMVTDGAANDTASLNITVLNVNDWEPRFRYPQYEFSVAAAAAAAAGGAGGAAGEGGARPGAGGLLPIGKVEVYDGDKGDYVSLSLRGPDASLFYINDMGEMYMKEEALSTLNTSLVQVLATAVDSGTPPRQSSVPVRVHVPARLLGAARAGVGGGAGAAVLAVFVAALTMLAALVAALLLYIYRSRRSKSSTHPSPGYVQHEKRPPGPSALPPAAPSSAAAPSTAAALGAAPSGSLLSVSAGASTILANSSSSLDLRGETLPGNGSANSSSRHTRAPQKSRVAPAPPQSPPPRGAPPPAPPAPGATPATPSLALMSDHLAGAGGRSGVAWPSSTIPTRVKKLSWDDAEHTGEMRQRNSATVDATNNAMSEHMNLTVYF